MPTDPQRLPAQVLHRIVHRDYNSGVVVEGAILFDPDGNHRWVEPIESRPMSWEEMGRQLLEPTPQRNRP